MKRLNGFRRLVALWMLVFVGLCHTSDAWQMTVYAQEEAQEEPAAPETKAEPEATEEVSNEAKAPEEDNLPPEENVFPQEETVTPEEEVVPPEEIVTPEEEILPPEDLHQTEHIEIKIDEVVSREADVRLPDSDELFRTYFNRIMYPVEESAGALMAPRGDLLEPAGQKVYAYLKEQITLVANGLRTSTEFEIPAEQVFGAETITWDELGIVMPFVQTASGSMVLSDEAFEVVYGDRFLVDMDAVVYALMSDIPYEMYWFDKTAGWYRTIDIGKTVTSEGISFRGASIRLWMSAAGAYSATGARFSFQTDAVKCGATAKAAENARQIVAEAAESCKNDYEILKFYLDKICTLTDYNHDAYRTKPVYGDPWQLVWIFDGNPATKVVCEGYAKGFKYLCDLTEFSSPEIEAHIVTGDISSSPNGSGPHMWNTVQMDDGAYYLVDATWCDTGTRNYDKFLKGYRNLTVNASGKNAYGYMHFGTLYHYVFDESTRSLFREELELSGTDYNPEWQTVTGRTVHIVFYDPARAEDADKADPYDRTKNPYTVDMLIGENYGVLPEAGYGRAGYTFDGWYTDLTGGKKIEADTVIDVKAGGSRTLYARWIPERYRVRFNVNTTDSTLMAGSAEKTVAYDGVYGELPQVSREGYKFTGWYTEPEGGEKITKDTTVRILTDIILYAGWEAKTSPAVPKPDTEEGTLLRDGDVVRFSTATPGTDIVLTLHGETPEASLAGSGDDFIRVDARSAEEDGTIIIKAMGRRDKDVSEVATYLYRYRNPAEEWGDITEEDRDDIPVTPGFEGTVTAADVPETLWIANMEPVLPYSGAARTQQELRVYFGKTRLTEGRDYRLTWKNNKNAAHADAGKKAPAVTVTGKGNYAGTVSKTFTIEPVSVEKAKADNRLQVQPLLFEYRKGKVQKGSPRVICEVDGKTITLKNGTDYTLSWPGTDKKTEDYNPDAFSAEGVHNIVLTGKGNYTGTILIPQTITGLRLMSKASVSKIANVEYTGDPIEPGLKVKFGKDVLTEDDYTAVYENNVEIGTAKVTIKGKGDYTGTKTATFKITGKALSKAKVAIDYTEQEGYDVKRRAFEYRGTAYMPAGPENAQTITDDRGGVTLSYGGKTLENGVDYTVSYTNNTGAGTAVMVFTGKGAFTGTVKRTFKIGAYDIAAERQAPRIRVTLPARVVYEKGGAKPDVEVTFTDAAGGTEVLVKGKDYTVKYGNHNQVAAYDARGTRGVSTAPVVTVTGKGRFRGSIRQTFTIEQKDIAETAMTVGDVVFKEKAGIYKVTPVLTDTNGAKLAAGKDYGKLTGKEGTIRYTYRYDTEVKNLKTFGKTKIPLVVQREEGDEVDAQDIIPAGTVIKVTVTGKNRYTGTKEACFRIAEKGISSASVYVPARAYTGRAVTFSKNDLTVKIGKQVLDAADYDIVGYSNNTGAGTAKLTIRGKGDYCGTKTVSFRITKKPW